MQSRLILAASSQQKAVLSLVLDLIRDGHIPLLKSTVSLLGEKKVHSLHSWLGDVGQLDTFTGCYNKLLRPLFQGP